MVFKISEDAVIPTLIDRLKVMKQTMETGSV